MTRFTSFFHTKRRYDFLRLALCAFLIVAFSGLSSLVAAQKPELIQGETAWLARKNSKLQSPAALLRGIRGITVGPIESSQQPNRGYGSPASVALLDHLREMNVNWVSITPFGRIWSLKSTKIDLVFEAPYEENRTGIKHFIAEAHKRNIRVLLIPHLWVESPGWRGEIDPGTKEGWAAFQSSYKRYLLAWAQNAAEAGADAISIGVECKSWSGKNRKEWEDIIASVRRIFPGLLTYSANWDEAENVIFWDLLDLIGVNAFYPLNADGSERNASDDEYLRGAKRWVQGLKDLSEDFERPILFVEIGYTTREDAAIEPWLWPDNMKNVRIDEREQARAMLALFHAFLPQDFFAGFFVWRYYADLNDASQEAIWGFSPHGKIAEETLRRAFHTRWAWDLDDPMDIRNISRDGDAKRNESIPSTRSRSHQAK